MGLLYRLAPSITMLAANTKHQHFNPFSAMGDFRQRIVMNFTYLEVKKVNPSFDILGERQYGEVHCGKWCPLIGWMSAEWAACPLQPPILASQEQLALRG